MDLSYNIMSITEGVYIIYACIGLLSGYVSLEFFLPYHLSDMKGYPSTDVSAFSDC